MPAPGHKQMAARFLRNRHAGCMGGMGLAWRSNIVILTFDRHQSGASDRTEVHPLVADQQIARKE